MIHDAVGHGQVARHSHGIWVIMAELNEGGLADEIAAEEHAISDFVAVELLGEFRAREGSGLVHGDFESEPRAVSAAAG